MQAGDAKANRSGSGRDPLHLKFIYNDMGVSDYPFMRMVKSLIERKRGKYG